MRTGYMAQRFLAHFPTGTIIAVFDRSAYLELNTGLVCLADAGLPEGPLMVPHPRPHALRLGENVTPAPDANALWKPPPAPRWSVGSLERGMTAITLPSEIHELLDCGSPGVTADLSSWLTRCMAGDLVTVPQSVNRLVGLGPGLTPSGDDFLGGIMVTVQVLGQPETAAALYEALDLSRTNRISFAHLTAAAEGAVAAPLHAVLNDVLCGRTETLPARLIGLNRMGHRSGWDALAGCYAALCAYCESAKTVSAA